MDTFSIVRRALDDSENAPVVTSLDQNWRTRGVSTAGRVMQAVQSVVDAITPPGGGKYVVGLVDISTAATDLKGRRIIISNKPLHDPRLSLIEKAVVMATFAGHEVGHTFITAPRAALIKAHNPKSGYHAVANLADDIILEPWMVDNFPILADAFEFTGAWVLENGGSLPITEQGLWPSTASRFNTVLRATRYGEHPGIVWANDRAREERDWSRAWADALLGLPVTDHAAFLALCDEAWERIRTVESDDEVESPEPIDFPMPPQGSDDDEDESDEGEPEPTDEDGEDEPGEDDTDTVCEFPVGGSDDEDDDEDEDEEVADPNDAARDWDDGEGEGEDVESDDEADEESDDESDDPTTDDDDGEGDPDDDEDDDPDDDEDDESDGDDWDGEDDDSDHDGEDEPDPDTGAGGGNDDEEDDDPDHEPTDEVEPESESDLRDEDDWDEDEVDESTHDQSEPDEDAYEAKEDEAKIRVFNSSTQIAFGKHGQALVSWE